MKRSFDPEVFEMMDRPQSVSSELEVDLENLRKMNRYFGGYRLLRTFLRRWMKPGHCYRILDLATGGGDNPRMIVDWARERDVSVRIDAVDRQSATLEIARKQSVAYPEIIYSEGDIREYESSLTYDVVFCTLALHHFSEDDAVGILRRVRTLSHDKVIVSDLIRNRLTQWCVWGITSTLYTEAMTRHDARLSVKRAFSFTDLGRLAREAEWSGFSHQYFPPARQAIWMDVGEPQPVMDLGDAAFNAATG